MTISSPSSTKLAILGGDPVRTELFPAYNVIEQTEIDAVEKVMRTGVLSRYLGTWHEDFYGGPEVQKLEKNWAETHGSTHCVSVNSATSGLYACVGAAGIGAGDEVIVSPYTMTASAVAPMIYNATPVFADIDPKTYCLSAETIAPKITPRTKAIIVVHIFGGCADMGPIMALAKKHNLIVIEDCAQAPLTKYKDTYVGTIGHMGVFSLNYHKHIHSGEGGLVTTNDANLCERLQLIRNHAEAVVDAKGVTDLTNMIGYNYRLGEIECAIASSLLTRLPDLIQQRRKNVAYLEDRFSELPHISLPYCANDQEHAYYVHALSYDEAGAAIPRQTVIDALKAELKPCQMRSHEGVLIGGGYVKPLYLQQIYQQRAHPALQNEVSYQAGLCPVVEANHYHNLITHELMRPGLSQDDLADIADAFEKVFTQLDQLRGID